MLSAFAVTLLFIPVYFHPNLNEMHLHKKRAKGSIKRYDLRTILSLKFPPVEMSKQALRVYVSLCVIEICVFVTNTFPQDMIFNLTIAHNTPHSKGNNGKSQVPHIHLHAARTHTHTHVYKVWKSEIRAFNVNACVLYAHYLYIFTTPSECNMSITPHLLFSFVTRGAAHRNSSSVPIINYIWILYRWAYTF